MDTNQSKEDLESRALLEFQKNQLVTWKQKTDGYIKENSKLKKLLEEALEKLNKIKIEPLQELIDYMKVIVTMVQDYASGEYKKIPSKTLSIAIMSILYFVVPTDIIPDWIISIGFLDDFVIVTNLAKQIQNDIESYKQWKERRDNIKKEV